MSDRMKKLKAEKKKEEDARSVIYRKDEQWKIVGGGGCRPEINSSSPATPRGYFYERRRAR